MRSYLKRSTLGLMLATGAMIQSPAPADNPKLTLNVQDATAMQAAAQLSRASGVPVQIQMPNLPTGVSLPSTYRALEEKASFKWNGVTFATALRELKARYRLQVSRQWGRFNLYPSGVANSASPAQKVGLVEKAGMQLFVRRVSVRNMRALDFAGGPISQDDQSLHLELQADLGESDSDLIAGIENVVAMDDQGNLLTGERTLARSTSTTLSGTLLPDEWACALNLTGVHPKATRLVWVEGDVLTYKSARTHPFEVALPLTPEKAKKTVGGMVVEVLRANVPAGAGAAESTAQLSVSFQVQAPLHSAIMVQGLEALPLPLLIDATGGFHAPTSHQQSARSMGGGLVYSITALYAPVKEEIRTLRLNIPERGEASRAFSFRMKDVPLPPEGAFIPRRNVLLPGRTSTPAPRAFYEAGGGTLVSTVKINGELPPGGALALGLAPKSGGENAGMRWVDLPIDKSGKVVLSNVRPGIYRVLRSFLPRQDLRLAGVGRWQNNEVLEVIVEAGENTTLPPLTWNRDPEPETTTDPKKPAASVKPPVGKPATQKPPVKKPAPKKPVVKKPVVKKPAAKKPAAKKPAPKKK